MTEEEATLQPSEVQMMPGVADGKHVRSALDGDVSAFGCLYDQYVRLVHILCYDVVGNHDQAEDLVHETFIRAYSNLAKLRDPEKFGSWLLGITHHVCKDWQRKSARDRHQYVAPDVMDDSQILNDADRRLKEDLRELLAQLPEKERVAIHLFYLEETPADQARNLLGLSQSGFYLAIQRGLERLRKMMALTQELKP